jgi:hypothetical protein
LFSGGKRWVVLVVCNPGFAGATAVKEKDESIFFESPPDKSLLFVRLSDGFFAFSNVFTIPSPFPFLEAFGLLKEGSTCEGSEEARKRIITGRMGRNEGTSRGRLGRLSMTNLLCVAPVWLLMAQSSAGAWEISNDPSHVSCASPTSVVMSLPRFGHGIDFFMVTWTRPPGDA